MISCLSGPLLGASLAFEDRGSDRPVSPRDILIQGAVAVGSECGELGDREMARKGDE